MKTSQKLKRAAELYQAGKLGDAEAVCRRVVEQQPDHVDALHLLALVTRKQGQLEEAESLFVRCLEKAPRRADIHANFGNLLRAAGRTDEAIAEYESALDIDATFRPARIALARAYNKAGHFTHALATCERLLANDPDDAEAWAARGTAHRGMDDLPEAEAAYRKAIELRPGFGAAHHNLGALLSKESRHEEALEQLVSAGKAGVSGPEMVFNLASTLAGLSKFDEAELLLTDATEAIPHGIELHRLLARLRFMRGDPEWDSVIRETASNMPDYPPLRIAYSQLLHAAGEFDKAYDVLGTFTEEQRNDKDVQAELSAVHQEAGRFEEALEAARVVAEGKEGYGAHVDLLIDPLMSLGRADEAMPLIELAREANPINQWYIAMEATAARLLGDPRYEELYDYERFVQSYSIETPKGWSSIEEFRRDLNAALVERHKFRSHPLDQSLRGGTQTPRGLLGDPDPIIQSFLQALADPIGLYRSHIGTKSNHPMTVRNRGEVVMTGCWSVRLGKQGYHVNHVHSEGWISSAYYAELPSEVEDTDARSGWIKFGEPRFPVPGAVAEKYVQPQVGMLVLFPSYMWHGTMPIHGDEPRMTVAYDAVCMDT
ncbi:MAG: tetratricopeptide repeat protein [Woeseiaceae bacterium]